MKRPFPVIFIAVVLGMLSLVLLIKGCGRGGDRGPVDSVHTQNELQHPTYYNIFIENSGSMTGFFSGNRSSDLETLIQDYYDRLTSENVVAGDTITLNYINTQKVNFSGDIKGFLSTAKSKCTEKYTKIDDILSMAMQNAKNDVVNIVISDFCFESDNGNFETAQSEIKKLFAQQLESNSNMSVAILKYDAGFNGKYYPGGIKCDQDMPVYFWIFGDANRVKKVLALSVKKQPLNHLLLQSSMTPGFSVEASNARAVNKKDIIVKDLKKERHEEAYKFEIVVNLNNSILNEEDLKEIGNYSVISSSASKYGISSINNSGDEYTFVISTDKPSPGTLTIKYNLSLPQWINDSNFNGSGLPKAGTTLGIKHLIGGVYDAYEHNADSYFTITVNLK